MELQKNKGKQLQWHPAFYAELQVEFKEDAYNMNFENEHQLGTKPKEIDVLIIKKNTEEPVRKNIGRIFKKHNIIEYKSPTDFLSIDDFYKVYAYACLYKVDTEKVDSIQMDEITITFFCYHWPRNFITHLQRNRGYNIRKVENGIYYIEGDIVSMQLILINELSEEENLWLRSLTDKLPNNNIVDKLIADYEQNQDNNLYRSVMDIIVRANKEKFGGNYMCDALEEIFEELYRERLDAEVQEKAAQKAEEMAKQRAEEMAKQRAEEMAKQRAEEMAKQRAEEMAKQRAEEIAKQRAEEKTQTLGNLISKLIRLGRIEDAEKAATNVVYREQLYREFGLG